MRLVWWSKQEPKTQPTRGKPWKIKAERGVLYVWTGLQGAGKSSGLRSHVWSLQSSLAGPSCLPWPFTLQLHFNQKRAFSPRLCQLVWMLKVVLLAPTVTSDRREKKEAPKPKRQSNQMLHQGALPISSKITRGRLLQTETQSRESTGNLRFFKWVCEQETENI